MIENIGAYSQVDYDRGYKQGRVDAIEECITMTTDERLCQIFEQLKEQTE